MSAPRKLKFRKLHDLMLHRVREVLLVSTAYDAFILQEDGHLTEQVFFEYKQLSLSSAPRFTHVSTGAEALEAMQSRRFDMVLVVTRVQDMELLEFARKAKALRPDRPVVVLTFDNSELARLEKLLCEPEIDGVYTWSGDSRILLAAIKAAEDRSNLEDDVRSAGVRVILVVEDSIPYYSAFLSVLYPELMEQSQSLFSEGLNRLQRIMRMRTRPKVVHVRCYEEALRVYNEYRDNILAVITDMGFERHGEYDEEAGLALLEKVRADREDMPVLVQSAEERYATVADDYSVLFVNKTSTSLLKQIRRFLKQDLGFGPFIFRLPEGTELCRAHDTKELQRVVRTVDERSLVYHAQRNHFSNWLMARSEFELAQRVRPHRVSDFDSSEELRTSILQELYSLRRDERAGVIADFSRRDFDAEGLFQRVGTGSLGGKARGIAFLDLLLSSSPATSQLGGMDVRIPQTFALATHAFDEFMEANELHEFAYRSRDDEEIAQRFQEAQLPEWVCEDLRTILDNVLYPVAVRSSSLLEDNMQHPFAGIYGTVMLPNCAESLELRLDQLTRAIKYVYATTFFQNAKAYLSNTARRIDEEKMGVVIQQLVGQRHDERYYPSFAGVAQSYNYYPVGPLAPEDGIAQMVLGFGHMVVDGGSSVRFCPRQPSVAHQHVGSREMLQTSQREFYALDLRDACGDKLDVQRRLVTATLDDAERDGTLRPIASVYSFADGTLKESVEAEGPWVVTFNNILKYGTVPLADALTELMDLTVEATGAAVEVEFAVDLGDYGRRAGRRRAKRPPTLYALQVRPIVTHEAVSDIEGEALAADRLVCRSTMALGHGRYKNLSDIVYVPRGGFERARSAQVAREVATINQQLVDEKRPYLLVGPGRWGSSDHWLGIPVQWGQIAGARVIVEASPADMDVDPSQGSHFFHNMTSLGMGYFTIPAGAEESFIDWDWFESHAYEAVGNYVRHIRLEQPLTALIDGRAGLGVVAR